MRFAINYSESADRLLEEKRIEVDLYKSPDWPDLIARCLKRKPVYVHFALEAGTGEPVDLDRFDRLARETGTAFINVHLSPRARDFAGGEGMAAEDEGGPVTERMIRDVGAIANRFGGGRVICENVPFGAVEEGFALACVRPKAIRRVIESWDCGLLLDLSHARLTARHLGQDERTYVSSLPVERLRELHLTGIQMVEGRARDHMGLTEQDWAQTRWAFDRIRRGDWARPDIVAFEYGGVGEKFEWRSDPAVIAEQVPRLFELVHAAG